MNEELYNKIVELIKVLKDTNSSNNIVIICTIISCIISLVALGISLYLAYTQIKEKMLKKKITGYIYSFFAPTYLITKLPSTKQIIDSNKNLWFSENDIFNTIVELNNQGLIEACGDLNTQLNELKWKPHTIYTGKENKNE